MLAKGTTDVLWWLMGTRATVWEETKTSSRNLTAGKLWRRKGGAVPMTKNADVFSSDLMTIRYLVKSMNDERGEGEGRGDATKGRSVEFDEWQDKMRWI